MISLTGALGNATTQPTTAPATPIVWHTSGVTSTKALSLAEYVCDEGIAAGVSDGSLKLSLIPGGRGYSYVEIKQRPNYTATGVVHMNIREITGGSLTLQAVCYDADGQAIKYVDLLDDIDQSGEFEVPLKIYRTPLAGAKTIGLRIWISGRDPHATVSGLWWGVVAK